MKDSPPNRDPSPGSQSPSYHLQRKRETRRREEGQEEQQQKYSSRTRSPSRSRSRSPSHSPSHSFRIRSDRNDSDYPHRRPIHQNKYDKSILNGHGRERPRHGCASDYRRSDRDDTYGSTLQSSRRNQKQSQDDISFKHLPESERYGIR